MTQTTPVSIVTVAEGCATILHRTISTDDDGTRRATLMERAFVNDSAGGYVRRWLPDGNAQQVFGSFSFGSGGPAPMWAQNADSAEAKATQVSREARLPLLNEEDFEAWKAEWLATKLSPADPSSADEMWDGASDFTHGGRCA